METRRNGCYNPKRKVASRGEHVSSERSRLILSVVYAGNPEHKKRPNDYGLNPPTNPRPGKTLCDAQGFFKKSDAEALLQHGIEKGMVSTQNRNGWPKNVWAVSDSGSVFEAQLENSESGSYHGYPLPEDDDFRNDVIREWKTR